MRFNDCDIKYKLGPSVYSAITDSILKTTQSAILTLAITCTAELGELAGFFGAFASIRLLPNFIKQLFFSLTIWLISIGIGLANVALFYSLLAFQMP